MTIDLTGIIGESPRMQEIFEQLALAAPTDATVLILGETGTGKELIARAIHHTSPRRDDPFVVVNCAAIPETLLESDLFGHERGAFTGALSRKIGRFAMAHGGTIFLDEIGELPLPIQAKILRVLQFKEVEPLGSNRIQKVDVRIIAATHRNLSDDVREGRFREDLYYRLNIVVLTLPPLRQRLEDIPLLAYHFFDHFVQKNNRSIHDIDPKVLQLLRRYPWPGNIRELENVIERAVIFCTGPTLTTENLPDYLQPKHTGFTPPQIIDDREPSLMDLERELIFRTLEKMDGNRQQAAQILGISQEELDFKLRAYRWQESH
ncbi:sigma-54 interaction domain-containing protein [Desulfobacca acetoxidans]|uniref:Sigma54 specific transcriptional regulator, Fis family n=1 Tax=Desulfobacca acetoxidans (strain ATCC 700848 / DSM 11109 / ASRB2) TaxID=880072 RepID=F2NHP9_DESAR|nr:sigma 54-interacting transcriptional regulator [Desulfobacca acetoxidans]AEB09236.1 sigma54 specific transcriptional regulator, Fis family [Desulfobacca acetoxidans DSM 11109]